MADNCINIKIILCKVHSDFSDPNILSIYCKDVEETKKTIKQNSQYQILLACREDDEDQLNIEFPRNNIHGIYILGQRIGRDRMDNKILRVSQDESMLKYHFARGASVVCHKNEAREWDDGDGTEAKTFNEKCVQLFKKYPNMH
jgi:hypothetical protein